MAKKNNSIMSGGAIALMAVLVYLFTSRAFLVALGVIVVFVIILAIVKIQKQKRQTEDYENAESTIAKVEQRIKINGYHPMFLVFEDSDKKLSEFYNAQNYLFFIRRHCYAYLIYFVPLAFRGANNYEEQFDNMVNSDMFPIKGRSHIFLAFKNLGKEKNIPDFSIAFKNFLKDFRPSLMKG